MAEDRPEESKDQIHVDYASELLSLRFDSCELNTRAQAGSISSLARVNREMKCLQSDLPCSVGAAIFVRADRTTLTHLQALISGPPDTPYAYGLYLFDINLPNNFPFDPPSISILTTANSSVRFNPNLYNTGKVCLSLINTWEGEPEERWRASCTLVQVLVTLQSMILDKAVAQREPGFEGLTLQSEENVAYSNVVKYANLRWAMSDMIKRPPLGFETVVRKHFKLAKEAIASEVSTWINQAKDVRPSPNIRLTQSHNAMTLELLQRRGVRMCLQEAYQQLREDLESLRE